MTDIPYERGDASRRLIREMPYEIRPLTRLQQNGCYALSDAEVLALTLQAPDALDLAYDVIEMSGGLQHLPRFTADELQRVPGIGEAMAARLIAAAELGRRIISRPREPKMKVTSPAEAANLLLSEMMMLEQEQFRVILLNTRNEVLSVQTLYIGSLNTSVIRLGEVFNLAIRASAAAIIVAHNHPSGDPSPSPEDVNITRQLRKAGDLMDIDVLDHVIIGHNKYVSLKERGLGFD